VGAYKCVHRGHLSNGTWRKRGAAVNTKAPVEQKQLSIRLLGAPEVSIEEGHPLRFGTKKSLALLCYLAAEGGRHPRRELAELLWPMSDERHARTDLRSALAKLRKTLGEVSARDKEVASFFVRQAMRGGCPL
jgi:two-component SAPR family response regulator